MSKQIKRIEMAEGKIEIEPSTAYDQNRIYIGGNTALSDYAMNKEIFYIFEKHKGKNVKLVLEVG